MQHDDIDNRIGASIRAERESRGWSLTELAARAAVSRAMIHKVERGDSSPTANLLGKLSGAFGLSMSTLLARAEAEKDLHNFLGKDTTKDLAKEIDTTLERVFGPSLKRLQEQVRARKQPVAPKRKKKRVSKNRVKKAHVDPPK